MMASPSAFSVRLMVATNMMPPGFTISRAFAQEQADIGDVLDHFHVEDDVERLALLGEGLGRGGAVVDAEPALRGVQLRHLDIVGRRIGADDLRAQPRHRLAEQAAAAADVEDAQAFERARHARIAAEALRRSGREYRPAAPD